ncbi:MAG: serine/threonine-protein phosphatase [Bacteroidetes bacterium]|nr:MAG: serine/threonine-protein phosphatase [Bacteroidota bacterium]
MIFTVEGISDKGLKRWHNEDHLLLDDNLFTDDYFFKEFNANTQRAVFAVADGMGGHKAGEVASLEVLKSLFNFSESLPEKAYYDFIRQKFNNWIIDAHMDLKRMSDENSEYRGMGTTLTGLLYYNGAFFWFHAGDSRLYIFHKGKLRQLTTDHTLAWMTNDPTIPSNYIANSIGGGKKPFLDMEKLDDPIEPSDMLLLCSDGLSDMLSKKELEDLLINPDLQKIMEKAYEKGARDNISLLLVKID